MTAPRPTRLRHVPVRLRVTVDPTAWGKTGRELESDVRDFCVKHIREQPLVIDARRDKR